MVGTTQSRVSFFMNRFREMGLIKYRGTLQVYRALRTFLLDGSQPRGLVTAGIDAALVETDVLGSPDKPVFAPHKRSPTTMNRRAEEIKLNQADVGADL